MTGTIARLLAGILPVVLFLLALLYLDSFKLLRLRSVIGALVAGGIAGGLSWAGNAVIASVVPVAPEVHARYLAPVIEEAFKALIVVYILRSHRLGFLVDAAIFGFAIGCGFAVVENVYYLNRLTDAHVAVWLLRGFGTAIMHGGTTAIFAILAKTLADREKGAASFLPGLLAVIAIHSAYNHFFLSPVLSSLAILIGLPPLLVAVFARSERSLREWLGRGFDADTELLRLIHSGEFSHSRVGRYLKTLRERFPGETVADMLCYLRLHVELSLRAKGELMMRESGFRPALEPELRAKFDEMRYLEKSIGRTGRLALLPFLESGRRRLWQLYVLGGK